MVTILDQAMSVTIVALAGKFNTMKRADPLGVDDAAVAVEEASEEEAKAPDMEMME